MGMAFARLEEGYESAMKDYYKKQVAQLKALIIMLIGQLSKGDRQKVMTICTIDVHARDVVAKMIAQNVSTKHIGDLLSVHMNIGVRKRLTYRQSMGARLFTCYRAGNKSGCLLQPFKTPIEIV